MLSLERTEWYDYITVCRNSNQRGIRFNPNGGGSWRKITREGRKNMSLKEWLDDSTD